MGETVRLMALTRQQIEAALACVFPEAQVSAIEPLGNDALLRLADGRVFILRCYAPGAAEPVALRLLSTALEVPVPSVVAFVEDEELLGSPFALLSPLEGTPLAEALPRLSETERYQVGRRLGQLIARIHTLNVPAYGALAASDPLHRPDERGYILARLDAAIATCGSILAPSTVRNLRRWFNESFVETNRPAALVHGALTPARVLVRRSDDGWRITGLIGWNNAQGWRPGWDHALLLDQASDSALFGMRVGYGEGYNVANQRIYEQVRELALAPYRMVRGLEIAAAQPAEAERHLRLVEALLAGLLVPLGGDEPLGQTLSA